MKIVIRNGYQHLDTGDGRLALLMDETGNAIEADSREWVETENAYILYPKTSDKNKLH
jgi:hypothetical protein